MNIRIEKSKTAPPIIIPVIANPLFSLFSLFAKKIQPKIIAKIEARKLKRRPMPPKNINNPPNIATIKEVIAIH